MRRWPVLSVKCCLAAARMVSLACWALLRSACTLWHRMPCVVDSVVHRVSVRWRDDSDVKFRSREQPLEARLWAMASPMPGLQLVSNVIYIVVVGCH